MKKDNPRIKELITLEDEINTIESIVSSCFTKGAYTPYYIESAEVIALAMNFLDGVTFEPNDMVYDVVMNDEELRGLILKFYYDIEDTDEAKQRNEDNFTYINLKNRIDKHVAQMVDFEKQKLIHHNDSLDIIAEFCEVVADSLSNFAKLNIKEMSKEDIQMATEFIKNMKDKNITETTLANAMKKVINAHKVPNTKIYEGQRERIAEQQAMLEEKELEITELRKWKQEHSARNVKSDK